MTLKNHTLPETRRTRLKTLLQEGNLVRVLESHNGISGIIANNVKIEGETGGKPVLLEFDALWESSLTDSASKGYPDIEVVSFDSRLHTIQEILAVTSKPLVVDGDTGGDANNFEYLVTRLERAGVSAVIIEDKVFPKRNSLEPGTQQTLEDPSVFAGKIRRGREVCLSDDFLIIARIESLIAGMGMKDALERARTYLEAGVDGIMIHSKSAGPEEILQFARSYKKLRKASGLSIPLVCVPTTYNRITEEELANAGFNMVIYANHLLRSAYKSMVETAKTLLIHQRSFEADSACAPVREIFKAVGFLDVKEKDRQDPSHRNIPVIIPAAGEERVLKDILGDKPRAMLEISGKTLLSRQINTLNANRLTDITVVAGYGADEIRAEGIRIRTNKNYRDGSMLNSLFTAREKMTRGFVMLFSDILLEDHILAKLLGCKEDIVLVVDNSIQYQRDIIGKTVDFVISRHQHVPSRRNISFVYENIIAKIGNKINPESATHEFIGLARFSKTGAGQFARTYDDCVKNHQGKIQEAEDVSRLDFTDLIQEMIDRGFPVNFLEIHKGWLEIHDHEDLALANELF